MNFEPGWLELAAHVYMTNSQYPKRTCETKMLTKSLLANGRVPFSGIQPIPEQLEICLLEVHIVFPSSSRKLHLSRPALQGASR